MTTELLNHLEERRKVPRGRKKCFGVCERQRELQLSYQKQGWFLSHLEVPVGQTEMLWFLFKMLLYLGN